MARTTPTGSVLACTGAVADSFLSCGATLRRHRGQVAKCHTDRMHTSPPQAAHTTMNPASFAATDNSPSIQQRENEHARHKSCEAYEDERGTRRAGRFISKLRLTTKVIQTGADDLASLTELVIKIAPDSDELEPTIAVDELDLIDEATAIMLSPAVSLIQRLRHHLLRARSQTLLSMLLVALDVYLQVPIDERLHPDEPTKDDIRRIIREDFPTLVLHRCDVRALSCTLLMEVWCQPAWLLGTDVHPAAKSSAHLGTPTPCMRE